MGRAGLRNVASVPIEPETKDWTWVLDETCPECGFDTRSVAATDVPALVRDNAAALARRPGPAGRRAAARRQHLVAAGVRVPRARRLPAVRRPARASCSRPDDPLFPNWDQDETAVAERYGEQDPATVAVELVAAGEAIAADFDAVQGDQWQRTGRRSDGAVFTIESFARYFVHDSVHHVHDVTT